MTLKNQFLIKLTTALGPQTDWEEYLIGLALEVPTEEKISSLPRIWDTIITRKYTFIVYNMSEINHSVS